MPNFFIVGAPKAGTTSLYHYLDQHPDIYMSPVKEPNYFAAEIRPENFKDLRGGTESDLRALREYLAGPMAEKRFGGVITEWDDYLKLFRNVKKETAIGEASVCYLWSKTAAQNIQAKIPNAKIIMVLRDPVDRAFSQYLQSLTGGSTRNSFRSYVETCLSRRNGQLDEFRFCLEFGEYSDAIRRYLDQFSLVRTFTSCFMRTIKNSSRKFWPRRSDSWALTRPSRQTPESANCVPGCQGPWRSATFSKSGACGSHVRR